MIIHLSDFFFNCEWSDFLVVKLLTWLFCFDISAE